MSRFGTALALCIALCTIIVPSADAAGLYGALLPEGSTQVGQARFRSSKDWDRTLRFFRSVYRREKNIVFQHLPSPPMVKAMYIENTKPGKRWEGINVYQAKGTVYLYVIANRDHIKSRQKSPKQK